ncbi:uncharacterized protein LOC143277264 [Babylonia areolata]|uniref:uncharacterized protein LOC143277264 n=1 Tax=Babylonia areolata TaxID=304850 RepID=UPI003FD45E1F
MQTMTMLLMTMMMAMMVSVQGQNPWPRRLSSTCREINTEKVVKAVYNNQQNTFQEFYCVGFAQKDSPARSWYHQLWVTDDEAAAACKSVNASVFVKSGKGGAWAPHPRTCFAYLICAGATLNNFKVDTLYFYDVQVGITSPGTYFNPVTSRIEAWDLNNKCAADPCKTNRPMTIGRECDKYLTCERARDGTPIGYQDNSCTQGQGFSTVLDICAIDSECVLELNDTATLYCNATTPPDGQALPGVPDNAYYIRTYKECYPDGCRELHRMEVCPAGLVFDPNNPNCTCVLKPAPCQDLDLINVGVNTPKPWDQFLTSFWYNFTVVPPGQKYAGWASFTKDVDFGYYDAQALAENELAGDWTLSFRFVLDQSAGNPASFPVMQNSLDDIACPRVSLRVSVINSQSLQANVVNQYVFPQGVTVELNNVVSRTSSDPTEVVLERRFGTLTLKAKLQSQSQFQQTSGIDLGT